MSFDSFGLHPDLMRAIAEAGYTTPTPIQAQAIPVVISGKDVMGAAQTGTGKTAAFTLPILQRLMPHASTSMSPARHPVRALMLAPTRELADQIAQNVAQYAKYVPLRSVVVFGGVDMNPQTAALRSGVEILIATPGRLLDHVQQKSVSLNSVSILVLDEADRMLDMGFLPDLQRIVNLLPKTRQSLLFSATFSGEIRKLAKTFLNEDPVVIEVAARNATAENVTQIIYEVDSLDAKRAAVAHLVKTQHLKQVIVFTNTKIGASRLARELLKEGIPADAIHGDKSQGERLATLEKFKKGEVEVMVATDVAARGLDIAELPTVINYDLPYAPEDYIHRIGRTGRAGASGRAVSLMLAEDQRLLTEIEKLLRITLTRERLTVEVARGDRSRAEPSSRGGYRGEGRGESRGESRGSVREGSREGSRSTPRAETPPGERPPRSPRRSDDDKPSRRTPLEVPASRVMKSNDPIFSAPYQPKAAAEPGASSGAEQPPASPVAATSRPLSGSIRRAARALPAILGGKPKT
jgi:ATP-dependent RNA helicase RhlE